MDFQVALQFRPNGKHQHARGSQDEIGWKVAPTLEFAHFAPVCGAHTTLDFGAPGNGIDSHIILTSPALTQIR